MRFRVVTMAAVVAVVAVVFVLAPAASALSAKQFRDQADKICRDGTTARTELLQQHFPDGPNAQPTAAQLKAFVGDYKTVVKDQIDQLAALQPPAKLKAKLNKLVSTARKALARVVAKPSLLLADSDPFAAVSRQSAALGLTECAS